MESKSEFLGKRIKATGLLSTDFRNFAYLQDSACGSGNILDLGRVRGVPEYESLRSVWLEDCARRGLEGLCVISEPVDVVGTVRRGDEGYLVLDIIRISAAPR
jgi:hypothetical protein